jgi:hypothetical protein
MCPEQKGFIDLWWFITDGGLLVLITWLLAQHRVWRHCAVRVFVVVENVDRNVADKAADTVRDLFKQKRILANVTVEAVILSDDMIEPYTYDLTLKIDSRQAARGGDIVPHSLDELFMDPGRPPLPPSAESSSDSVSGSKRQSFKRLLNTALHPRRSIKEYRQSKRISVLDPPVRSVTEAFARQGAITQENEKDLLNTLNERCRLRRQTLDEQRAAAGAIEESGEDEECVSVVGELTGSSSPIQQGNAFERLNQVILSRSKESSLVLMNLPDMWGTEPDDCASYLAFCDCLVTGLERVVFVHSSGTEVVRIF